MIQIKVSLDECQLSCDFGARYLLSFWRMKSYQPLEFMNHHCKDSVNFTNRLIRRVEISIAQHLITKNQLPEIPAVDQPPRSRGAPWPHGGRARITPLFKMETTSSPNFLHLRLIKFIGGIFPLLKGKRCVNIS